MSSSRLLRRLAVASGFGLLLAFVPLPGLQFSIESVGATTELPATTPMSPADLGRAQAAADEPLGADRVVAEDPDAGEFTAIGLTFDTPQTEPVMVRVKEADGGYGEWQELGAGDGGPDPGTAEAEQSRNATEPLWVKKASGYQISVAATDAATAQVATVRDVERRSVVQAEPMADAAAAPPFGINLRSSWGARAPTATSYGSTVKLAVVHHSVTPNDYSPADVPAWLRSIQAYHMDSNGWSDIAYNFVVDKYGGIWEGRGGGIDRSVIGGHAMGFNTNSVGVMVLGDYTGVGPSAASVESVSRVVGWKLFLFGNQPNGRVNFTSNGSNKYAAGVTVNLPVVVGHQDVQTTGCPGSIQASLPTVRARSQDWYNFVAVANTAYGHVDNVSTTPGTVRVDGWAKDPPNPGAALAVLEVAGRTVLGRTGISRPDVVAVLPDAGPNSGFSMTASGVPPGFWDACVSVVNENRAMPNSGLGCFPVVVGDPAGTSPFGYFTVFNGRTGAIDVAGVTADPDAPGSRTVTLEVDGVARRTVPTDGGGGFSAQIVGIPGGRHRVCAVVRNGGAGVDVRVDCEAVDVTGTVPYGHLDAVRIRNGNIAVVQGWSLDLESSEPLSVTVYWNGQPYTVGSDGYRPDVAALFPGYDARRGFYFEATLPKGAHRLCAVANGYGQGPSANLGCGTLVVK